MRRVTREQVEMKLAVALTVQRPAVKRAVGADMERVRNELAKELTARIMGQPDNEAVLLVPSTVNERKGERPGKWGEDELHPDAFLPPEPVIGSPPSKAKRPERA